MNTPAITPANFTRRTKNLPARFARQGRFDLVVLYHFLRLSDLAREGIAHSGSFRFADHLYRNEPSGRGWLGRWLDGILLNLPASRAMRSRCPRSSNEMRRAFDAHVVNTGGSEPFRILTVPCGIPRDVRDFAVQPGAGRHVAYSGMDLDPAVVQAARTFMADSPLDAVRIFEGNALDGSSYRGRYHFIASTGLGEFLNDAELQTFYGNVFEALRPGGIFFTSALAREKMADALLRTFELRSHYRTGAEIERVLAGRSWKAVAFDQHWTGLQTFIRATKD